MSIPPARVDLRAIAPALTPATPRVTGAKPLPDTLPAVRPAEPFNLSGTAVAARALAAAPPADSAKVAGIRAAIADGSYVVDPARIAAKMIALDLP